MNDPPVLANPGNKTPNEKTELTFSLTATDGDVVAGVADSVTYSIVTGSLPGMTLDDTTGAFSWTPTETQDGQQVVVFRAKDNHNAAGADQTVTITVGEVNDPPVLANPGNKTPNEKSELTFSLTATDGDVVAGVADSVTYSIVTGSLPGMTLDGTTGAFSWTPTETQDGQQVVVFRAKDNHDAAGTDQTVTITVGEVNDPPVLTNPGNKNLDEKSELSFSLTATDGDVVAGVADTVTYSIVTGSLPGMTLDGTTGAFSWTPTETQDGQQVVVFRAKDNHDAAGTDQTVTITVGEVNDPPVLTNPGNKVLDVMTELSFSLTATDGDIVAGVADSVIYSIVTGSQPGMTLNDATGAFSWTPTVAQVGQHVVVFRATDNHDVAGPEQTITITVGEVNDPPTAINLVGSSLKENISGATVGTLSATDPDDGQTHTFTTADPRFEIVDTTLKLKVDVFVVGATVSVEVTATDSGTPPQALTQTLVINVTANARAWQYAIQRFDTNADGSIVPLDALRIINQLNDPTILGPGGRLPEARPAMSTLPYYDANGDGFCTSNDVLQIVNYLNSLLGEAEAESSVDGMPLQFALAQPQPTPSAQPPESVVRQRRSAMPGGPTFASSELSTNDRGARPGEAAEQVAFPPERLSEDLESILDEIADEVWEGWLPASEAAPNVRP